MEYGDITRQNESVQNPLPVIIFISRDNTLADGNQAITGVGFKPSYVHFQYSESPGFRWSWFCPGNRNATPIVFVLEYEYC
jgi:hypothetical protein